MLKFNNFLIVSAWDVTKFYAMLTFCITLIGNKLFKIIFLFETTFIFPQHYLSREVCMIYPDSYWLSAYLLPFMGVSTPLWFGAWNFYLMAIIFQIFRRYLWCARLENLFTNCIFMISFKNCTLQLNFEAQLPVTKYQIFNAKSLIQPTWRHLLPEKLSKSQTFNNYFRTVLAHF